MTALDIVIIPSRSDAINHEGPYGFDGGEALDGCRSHLGHRYICKKENLQLSCTSVSQAENWLRRMICKKMVCSEQRLEALSEFPVRRGSRGPVRCVLYLKCRAYLIVSCPSLWASNADAWFGRWSRARDHMGLYILIAGILSFIVDRLSARWRSQGVGIRIFLYGAV